MKKYLENAVWRYPYKLWVYVQDTVDEQVGIAKRNAFIQHSEPVKLYRFRVIRHH